MKKWFFALLAVCLMFRSVAFAQTALAPFVPPREDTHRTLLDIPWQTHMDDIIAITQKTHQLSFQEPYDDRSPDLVATGTPELYGHAVEKIQFRCDMGKRLSYCHIKFQPPDSLDGNQAVDRAISLYDAFVESYGAPNYWKFELLDIVLDSYNDDFGFNGMLAFSIPWADGRPDFRYVYDLAERTGSITFAVIRFGNITYSLEFERNGQQAHPEMRLELTGCYMDDAFYQQMQDEFYIPLDLEETITNRMSNLW